MSTTMRAAPRDRLSRWWFHTCAARERGVHDHSTTQLLQDAAADHAGTTSAARDSRPVRRRFGYSAVMVQRWIRVALVAGAACGSPQPAPNAPPAVDVLLGPDGHHVAKERVYEGDCMPAGTRGGCHTVTLRPDGTYRNFLFDAAMDGTYTIDGAVVSLKRPEPEPITMTLSADGTKLDALALKP